MVNKSSKSCITLCIFGEIQMKTELDITAYLLVWLKSVLASLKHYKGCETTGIIMQWECKMIQPLSKTISSFFPNQICSLTLWSSSCMSCPEGLKTYIHAKKSAYGFFHCFIHNCWSYQDVLNWVDKLHIQTVEYFSALKRNELLNHEKPWRNHKCVERVYILYNSNYMMARKG